MANITKAIVTDDGTVTNLIDPITKQSVNYKPITVWYDGTPMTNAKCDGRLYRRKGSIYYKQVIDKEGELFLEKDTMAQMRNLSSWEVLLIKAGVLRGVRLNGYYTEGDTPGSISYFISDIDKTDDLGSIIQVGDLKFEHKFEEKVDARYYGAKADGIYDNTFNLNTLFANQKKIKVDGGVYRVNGTLYLAENNDIYISKDAVLKCYGGRIMAYRQNNITINLEGEIHSIGMTINNENVWSINYLGYSERAFLEFGGVIGAPAKGFKLYGNGHIKGDLVGDTTFDPYTWSSNPANTDLLNLKGIGVWESYGDIYISSGIKVSRFKGEAVYFHSPQTPNVVSKNVLIEGIEVFDVGFNAINFNGGNVENCRIKNCRVYGFSGQCVELSDGTVEGCDLRGSVGIPIQMGDGNVFNVDVLNNTIYPPQLDVVSINASAAAYNAKTRVVNIKGNTIIDAKLRGIDARNIGHVNISENIFRGWTESKYAVNVESTVVTTSVKNNIFYGDGLVIFKDDITKGFVENNIVVKSTNESIMLEKSYSNVIESKVTKNNINTIGRQDIGFEKHYTLSPTPQNNSVKSVMAKEKIVVRGVNVPQDIAYADYIIATRRSDLETDQELKDTLVITYEGIVRPAFDNEQKLGNSNYRWLEYYGATSDIITSDRNFKTEISDIDESVLKAWGKVDFKKYKIKSSVKEKGDKARYHFGLIAQDIQSAFESEGLNAFDYGLLCANNVDGEEVLSVRYDEIMVLESAYIRYKLGV